MDLQCHEPILSKCNIDINDFFFVYCTGQFETTATVITFLQQLLHVLKY